jgi:plastocyanin
MKRKYFIGILAILSIIMLVGCQKPADDVMIDEPIVDAPTQDSAPTEPVSNAADGGDIIVSGTGIFDPNTLTIKKGSTVVFTSSGDRTHILSLNGDESFRSPRLEDGDSFEYVFENPGEFEVWDVIFKKTMIITVE